MKTKERYPVFKRNVSCFSSRFLSFPGGNLSLYKTGEYFSWLGSRSTRRTNFGFAGEMRRKFTYMYTRFQPIELLDTRPSELLCYVMRAGIWISWLDGGREFGTRWNFENSSFKSLKIWYEQKNFIIYIFNLVFFLDRNVMV